MESTILRSQVFEEIFSGDTFDMEFVTADRKRDTGGDLISVEGWRLLTPEDRYQTGTSETANELPGPRSTGIERNPDHAENGTLHIYNPGNRSQHITKVHVDLIQIYNGKIVTNG